MFEKRLADGRGETLYDVGFDEQGSSMGLTEEELGVAFETLCRVAASLDADCSLIHKKRDVGGWMGIVMMRNRSNASESLEIRVACILLND